ncbi:peptide methionine sulfoxide reductase [Vitreoscilla filiformis]|uniref:Peptide methionine sulfoxide reductase MsrA n=2 Tax=Vitreoscilla filiformis TaxID=63 RepID=A0A221KER9_VITFI|nr:peptide methionine sulfoxide reductase [Vitreoscilla filiformis]
MNETPEIDMTHASITLAGGCFWCLEAVYEQVRGVVSVESGYANGTLAQPSYEAVCTGRTGHAEVVRVVFDPAQVSLADLLRVFFVIHDPTTLNRQGNDVGTQYRSGIYWHDEATQRPVIDTVLAEVRHALTAQGAPDLVTEAEPLRAYWPAEPEHQHYFARHPHQGYCAWVVAPKVDKFRQVFASLVRPDAAG